MKALFTAFLILLCITTIHSQTFEKKKMELMVQQVDIPASYALDPNGKYLYIIEAFGIVKIIDIDANKIVNSIDIGTYKLLGGDGGSFDNSNGVFFFIDSTSFLSRFNSNEMKLYKKNSQDKNYTFEKKTSISKNIVFHGAEFKVSNNLKKLSIFSDNRLGNIYFTIWDLEKLKRLSNISLNKNLIALTDDFENFNFAISDDNDNIAVWNGTKSVILGIYNGKLIKKSSFDGNIKDMRIKGKEIFVLIEKEEKVDYRIYNMNTLKLKSTISFDNSSNYPFAKFDKKLIYIIFYDVSYISFVKISGSSEEVIFQYADEDKGFRPSIEGFDMIPYYNIQKREIIQKVLKYYFNPDEVNAVDDNNPSPDCFKCWDFHDKQYINFITRGNNKLISINKINWEIILNSDFAVISDTLNKFLAHDNTELNTKSHLYLIIDPIIVETILKKCIKEIILDTDEEFNEMDIDNLDEDAQNSDVEEELNDIHSINFEGEFDISVSKDSSIIVVNYKDFDYSKTFVYDKTNSKLDEIITENLILCTSVDSYNGLIYLGGIDRNIYVYNIRKKNIEKILSGHSFWVTSMHIDDEEGKLYSGDNGGWFNVWDLKQNQLLISFWSNGLKWVCFTPDGRFDASSPEALDKIHYVAGLTPITLEQLNTEKFYQPGLYQIAMEDNLQKLEKIDELDSLWLFPDAEIDSVDDRYNFEINLENRGGGFGDLELWIDEVPISQSLLNDFRYYDNIKLFANGKQIDKEYLKKHSENNDTTIMKLTIKVEIPKKYFISGKQQIVKIRAWNKDKIARTRDIAINYTSTGKIPQNQNVKLFMVAVGVSDYTLNANNNNAFASKGGAFRNLNYAKDDARNMANAIKAVAGNVLDKDNIYTFTLNSEQGNLPPVKENIIKILDSVANLASANDIFIFYYSGHGESLESENSNRKQEFYFIPANVSSHENLLAGRRQDIISETEFTEISQKIPANKRALILDACKSGRFVDNQYASSKNSMPYSRDKIIKLIRESSGMIVISGSESDQESFISNVYEQSLLTRSLLMGLKSQQENEVDIVPWFNYAFNFTNNLAEEHGKVQMPQIVGRNSFIIGKLDKDIRKNIEIRNRKPVISGVTILNNDFEIDENIEKITTYLEELITKRNVDRNDVLFINNRTFPQSYKLTGSYKELNNKLEIEIKLKYSEEKSPFKIVKKSVSINFETTEIQELVNEIIKEIINKQKELTK